MKSDIDLEQMIDAIDETLIESDRMRFEQLLSNDPNLSRNFNEIKEIKRKIERLPEVEEPNDFTSNVMQQIGEIERPWWIRLRHFLLRKHSYQFTLLGALSGAAASFASLAIVVTILWPDDTTQPLSSSDTPQHYLMRFSYNNPLAKQVFVAGSFNQWRKEQIPLIDTTGNGQWIGMLQIEPGVYEYMFYVDGQWVTDKQAQRFKDDGFGRKNAILQLGIQHDISI
jgi:hypothetical protein